MHADCLRPSGGEIFVQPSKNHTCKAKQSNPRFFLFLSLCATAASSVFTPCSPPPPVCTLIPLNLRGRRGRLCTICQVKGVLSLSLLLYLFLSLSYCLSLSLCISLSVFFSLVYLFFLSNPPPHIFFSPTLTQSSVFACRVFANWKTVTQLECRNPFHFYQFYFLSILFFTLESIKKKRCHLQGGNIFISFWSYVLLWKSESRLALKPILIHHQS